MRAQPNVLFTTKSSLTIFFNVKTNLYYYNTDEAKNCPLNNCFGCVKT